MFDRRRQVMTTMSEIVLMVCLVREQLLQYMVAIIHNIVRFRRGCHRYRWQVLSALTKHVHVMQNNYKET